MSNIEKVELNIPVFDQEAFQKARDKEDESNINKATLQLNEVLKGLSKEQLNTLAEGKRLKIIIESELYGLLDKSSVSEVIKKSLKSKGYELYVGMDHEDVYYYVWINPITSKKPTPIKGEVIPA